MEITASAEEMQKRVEVFCCYARKDQSLLQALKIHLTPLKREGLIALWADADMNAGTDWEKELHLHLNTAHIILLLISPDFMASEYCYSIEMTRAIERHKKGEAQVIPILARPVAGWQDAPFGKLQALPRDAKPITLWQNEDAAFVDVAEGVRQTVRETVRHLSLTPSSQNTTDPPPPPPPHLPHLPALTGQEEPPRALERDEILKEVLGTLAEPYIPWVTAFALLAGLGIGAATIIRSSVPYSWLWSMGTVLVATPLIYLTAYRKVVNIYIMIIIALLSVAGAAGLAAYTSTFIDPSETNNLFLFSFSQKVSLDRQLYIGLIIGGGMGLLASVGGTLTEGLDDPWDLIWGSNRWGAIIWLGLAALAFLVKWVSRVGWEFGFGYGWDISLMAVEAGILIPLGITYWLRFWIKGAKVKIV